MEIQIPDNQCGYKRKCYKACLLSSLLLILVAFSFVSNVYNQEIILTPAQGEKNVNPDVRLRISFLKQLILGKQGEIRVYDASNDSLVDLLDLSIPPGPKNYRAPAPYDTMTYISEQKYLEENKSENGKTFIHVPLEDIYQHTYIGGNLESDVYHFYPVLLYGNEVTIYLHHNCLDYNKTYYVQIDPEVFSLEEGSFEGMEGKNNWRFTTKQSPPSLEKDLYVVSSDGKGDFNTVLGAVEFIPDNNPKRKTIYIKNGRYEEIVYFRNKENISIIGEDRDKVLICYANNGFFNPRPTGPRNEMIKRFRNRRSVFAVHNSNGIHLANFTVQSLGEKPAQAEGLLVRGEQNIVSDVTIIGSGDALQATGSIYIIRSGITGFGDNVLGYGAVFFQDCEMVSTYGPHLWVRNTEENHGNIFLNCRFSATGDVETVIARAPSSQHYSFPNVEAVLISCTMEGIKPEGWGKVGEEKEHIRYWDYNSIDPIDGKPVDISQRVPYSRQLTWKMDSAIIANYSNPEYILKGWVPQMAPFITSQPDTIRAKTGETIKIQVNVLSIPEADYQWLKDRETLKDEKNEVLTLENINVTDAGNYMLKVENNKGSLLSKAIRLIIE